MVNIALLQHYAESHIRDLHRVAARSRRRQVAYSDSEPRRSKPTPTNRL